MASHTQNTKKTSINEILNRPVSSEDIKLVDYVVNLDTLSTSGKPWEDIESSAYVFEMCLRVNIDKLLDTRIKGYTVQVTPMANLSKDGSIKEKGAFKLGLKQGDWKMYDIKGKLDQDLSGTYDKGIKINTVKP